jgi:hypothetical protein
MKLVLQIIFLLLCIKAKNLVAQENPTTEKQVNIIALCKETEGTYKVIPSNPRMKVVLTSDVCEVVKKNRKKSETTYLKYNENITLEIYSEEKIKKLN